MTDLQDVAGLIRDHRTWLLSVRDDHAAAVRDIDAKIMTLQVICEHPRLQPEHLVKFVGFFRDCPDCGLHKNVTGEKR